MRHKSSFRAYLLIFLGTYFLLLKLGLIPSVAPLISEWWPVLLILVGLAMLARRWRGEASANSP